MAFLDFELSWLLLQRLLRLCDRIAGCSNNVVLLAIGCRHVSDRVQHERQNCQFLWCGTFVGTWFLLAIRLVSTRDMYSYTSILQSNTLSNTCQYANKEEDEPYTYIPKDSSEDRSCQQKYLHEKLDEWCQRSIHGPFMTHKNDYTAPIDTYQMPRILIMKLNRRKGCLYGSWAWELLSMQEKERSDESFTMTVMNFSVSLLSIPIISVVIVIFDSYNDVEPELQ